MSSVTVPTASLGSGLGLWLRGMPARHGGIAVLATLVVILALATALRVGAALNPPSPNEEALLGKDSRVYAYLASSLYERGSWGDASHEVVKNPNDWSPGTPLLIAGVYFASGGEHPDLARVVIALLGAATVLLTYLIARRLAARLPSRRAAAVAGLTAALLVAVYPVFAVYSRRFFGEPVAALTLAAAVLSLLWAAERRSPWAYALPGLLIGLTALVRPEYLAVGVLLVLVAGWQRARREGRRAGFGAGAVFACAFIAAIVPWTVRNYDELGRVVPIATGGGKAFYIGTYLPGRGSNVTSKAVLLRRNPWLVPPEHRGHELTTSELRFIDFDPVLAKLAAARYPGLERDAALTRMARSNLRRFALGQPLAYLGMAAEKLWGVWRRTSGTKQTPPAWIAFHLAIVAVGLAGLVVLARRRRSEALLLALILISVTAVSVVTLATPRRTVPLMPLVCACAGVGVAWGAGRLAARRAGRMEQRNSTAAAPL